MASRAFRPLPRLGLAATLSAAVSLTGCQTWLNDRYADSLPPTSGEIGRAHV